MAVKSRFSGARRRACSSASWNFTEAIFGSAELLERVVMVKLSSSEDSEEDVVMLLS